MKSVTVAAVLLVPLSLVAPAFAADTYKVDPVHSSVVFRAHHGGIGYVWGRFNDPTGNFVLDESDPAKSTFAVEVPAANVDTHNEKRDDDLKGPRFFDAKTNPAIAFKSTSVKKGEGKVLEVTGTIEMHGVTKTVTLNVELTGQGEMPAGTKRAGLEATFTVKLSDYGIKVTGVGDEVKVIVAIEGIQQ